MFYYGSNLQSTEVEHRHKEWQKVVLSVTLNGLGTFRFTLTTRSMVNGARCVCFDKVEAATDPAEPGTGGSEGSGEDGEDDGNHQLG